MSSSNFSVPNSRFVSNHNRYNKPPPPLPNLPSQQQLLDNEMMMIKENTGGGSRIHQVRCTNLLPYLNLILILILGVLVLIQYSHVHHVVMAQNNGVKTLPSQQQQQQQHKKHHEIHFKIHLKSGQYIRYPKDTKENVEELNINRLSEYHLCCRINGDNGEYFICDNGGGGSNSLECIVKRGKGNGKSGQSFLEIYAGERHVENARCTFGWIDADTAIII